MKLISCLKKLVLPLFIMSLSSCAHIFTKSDTYDTSSSVEINGAKVSSGLKPMGGQGGFSLSALIYTAGSAKLEGPFIWRIEAEGKAQEHTKLVVHRVKVETSKTNRKEWYPGSSLGVDTAFVDYKKEPGKSYAVYQIPGRLKVDSTKDGDITIYADITISSKSKTERKNVKFFLPAEQNKKEKEFVFFPAEIVNSFGQQDPRQWKF